VSSYTHPKNKLVQNEAKYMQYNLYGKGPNLFSTFTYICNKLTGRSHKDRNAIWVN
jgi:hypothetical protein